MCLNRHDLLIPWGTASVHSAVVRDDFFFFFFIVILISVILVREKKKKKELAFYLQLCRKIII